MSTVKTVGELRALIAGLPDDMPLVGYDGSDQEKVISWWISKPEDDNFEESSEEPALVLSTD